MPKAKRPMAVEQPKTDEVAQARQLRPAPTPAPKLITRKFFLDSPLGEVSVTVRGPAGAAKLTSTHTSISISTSGEEPSELPVQSQRRAARTAPVRELSGNPNEPSGTVSEWLPGDDEGEAATALRPDSLDFLRSMERSEMRRANQE